MYLAAFTVYTWPWLSHFSSEFFTDTGDGYQNVWNMWWINRSVTVLHHLPWHTDLLHHPYGTSLLGQTMNPFNGFVGIVLLRFCSLVQAFNVMVVFSFVATGVTGFWLCWYFCRRATPALIGGFLITFSGYHLSKTLGLMQLVSLEWVPLFVLLWWHLLTHPRVRWAAAAAVSLALVVLCDYYYFLFCVLSAAAILVHLLRARQLRLTRRAGVVFGTLTTLLAAPLPAALVISNLVDPMTGGHLSQGTDLFSLVIDGGRWRFSSLTRWYYGHRHVNLAEFTVYLPLVVTTLVGVAVGLRRRLGATARFWLWYSAVAAVFTLGPYLVVHGHDTGVPLPFELLKVAIPLLEYNVEPDRIVVLVTLGAAVLAAMVLSRLDPRRPAHGLLLGLVGVVLFLELWPAAPPAAPAGRAPYVAALARLPPGGVIDDAAVRKGTPTRSLQLYDQVLDGKPLAFGYISRTPATVAAADAGLEGVIRAHDYGALCHRYGFRYFTTLASRPLPGHLRVLYDDGHAIIYALC